MTTKRVTITLPEEVCAGLREWSQRSGTSVSKLVTLVMKGEVLRQVGLAEMADWEAEHGAFTPAELAAARAEMAAADAELFAALVQRDAI